MLTKLVLKNCQKWKKKTIRFDKYVTVIIGKNDAGKSSIVRVLRAIATNKFAGTKLIKRGCKSAKATLYLDGVRLSRSFGRSGGYAIENKKFKAVGIRVPEEVKKLLALEEINFQQQRDDSFWFALSPGEVAKEFNAIVDLEAIDRIQGSLVQQLREKTSALKAAEERYSAASAECRRLRWVRQFDVALRSLLRLSRQYRVCATDSHAVVASALKMAVRADTQSQRLLAGQPIAHRAAIAGRKFWGVSGKLSGLRSIMSQARAAQSRASVKLPDILPLAENTQKLTDKYRKLNYLLKRVHKQEKELCQCERRKTKKEQKLEKNLGGRCPLCGGILTDRMPV